MGFTQTQIKRYNDLFKGVDIRLFTTNGFIYNYFEIKDGRPVERGGFNLRTLRSRRTFLPDDVNESDYLSTEETMLELGKK